MTTPNPESLNNIIAKIKDDVGKIVETVKKLPAEHEQRKHLPNWLQPIHTTFNSIQPVKLTGDGKDLENLNKALGPCLDAAIELTNIVVYEREGKNGKDATAVTKDLLQGTINVAEDPYSSQRKSRV
ncbi:unnamed protein product [Parascedosporium putredinis]|uniref:Uncharacterized protein n=1 Tax=Parascedosporium putredinis TaxID=1442378 RepID=A0A9P1M9V8_9PEZI|nr:unnamed protein product [Parascedosporium putredinis]CAI7992831.1 unnamed protein product [Parascedosporium putredinis]